MMICYNSKSRRISMIQEILQSQAAKDDKTLTEKLKEELRQLTASRTPQAKA